MRRRLVLVRRLSANFVSGFVVSGFLVFGFLVSGAALGCSPVSESAGRGERGRSQALKTEPVPGSQASGHASAPPRAVSPVGAKAIAVCGPQLIRREGLKEDAVVCAEGIKRFESAPAADHTCTTDSDCRIFEAAGGCLGVALSTLAEPAPLPGTCGGPQCAHADFTDHKVACRSGCCEIYES